MEIKYQSIIPPLTAEEYAQLEQNILVDGIREPLVMWGDVLIDGHNRYSIAQKHKLPYDTVQMEFDSDDAARLWIYRNQLGRRNLPLYERAKIALQLKPIIAEKAKERQARKPAESVLTNSSEQKPINTRREVAKIAGVAENTIQRVEKIEQEAPPEIKQKLQAGDLTINEAYRAIKKPHISYNSGENEWYTPKEYIEAAREVMGSIDLDPASSDIANKTVRAAAYYDIQTDGLMQRWYGNVWLNPPYSSDLIVKFTDKLVQSIGDIQQAIVLVNNATETRWFQSIANAAMAVVFPRGRIKFETPQSDTGAPLQGQAFLYFGDNTQSFLGVFKRYGWGALL